jgi:hypothetical protein
MLPQAGDEYDAVLRYSNHARRSITWVLSRCDARGSALIDTSSSEM